MATAQDRLNQILPSWYDLLTQWSLDGSLVAAATDALMLDSSNAKEGSKGLLQSYISQWSAGNFQNLPQIVLLSAEDISGAYGSYADSTDTIYLNQDWLLSASEPDIQKVLTHELGHFLDGQLNNQDTMSEEGDNFSRLLLDEPLIKQAGPAFNASNDIGTVYVQGAYLPVEQAIADVTPPQVKSISFDRPAIDLVTDGYQVKVSGRFTDDISGLALDAVSIIMSWTSPSGQTVGTGLYNLESGTIQDGIFSGSVSFGKYAEAGTWKLSRLDFHDLANNAALVTPQDLGNLGINTDLQVSNALSDTTKPELKSISIAPAVDLGAAGYTVKVTGRFTDNLAGLAFNNVSIIMDWWSPSGQRQVGTGLYNLESGTLQDGIFSGVIDFGPSPEAGVWKIGRLFFQDQAMNNVELYRQDLINLGLNLDINVAYDTGDAVFRINGNGTGQDTQSLTCILDQLDPDGMKKLPPSNASDPTNGYTYQWQVSSDGVTWTKAAGTGADTFKYSVSLASDANKFLRVQVGYKDDKGIVESVLTQQVKILSGTSKNDAFLGTSGVEVTFSGSGADAVATGAGNDFAKGGIGNDTFNGADGDGDDFFDGQTETDTLNYSSSAKGVDVDFVTGLATERSSGGIGKDAFAGIDNARGTSGADIFNGNSGVNIFTGSGGADVFKFMNKQLGAAACDHITDFSGDQIQLSKLAFGLATINFASVSGSKAANAATASLVYDTGSGYLYLNTDGSTSGFGTGGGVIAILDNKAALTSSNFALV